MAYFNFLDQRQAAIDYLEQGKLLLLFDGLDEVPKAYADQVQDELMEIEKGDEILLKPKYSLPQTSLDQVAGCLKFQGNPKSLAEMEDAIRHGIEENHNGDS